jgi:hypothetical protein
MPAAVVVLTVAGVAAALATTGAAGVAVCVGFAGVVDIPRILFSAAVNG